MILTCDRRYTLLTTYIKDLISKNFKNKENKSFKNSKSGQNNQNLVFKKFLLLKYQKFWTFLVKKNYMFFSVLLYGITLYYGYLRPNRIPRGMLAIHSWPNQNIWHSQMGWDGRIYHSVSHLSIW